MNDAFARFHTNHIHLLKHAYTQLNFISCVRIPLPMVLSMSSETRPTFCVWLLCPTVHHYIFIHSKWTRTDLACEMSSSPNTFAKDICSSIARHVHHHHRFRFGTCKIHSADTEHTSAATSSTPDIGTQPFVDRWTIELRPSHTRFLTPWFCDMFLRVQKMMRLVNPNVNIIHTLESPDSSGMLLLCVSSSLSPSSPSSQTSVARVPRPINNHTQDNVQRKHTQALAITNNRPPLPLLQAHTYISDIPLYAFSHRRLIMHTTPHDKKTPPSFFLNNPDDGQEVVRVYLPLAQLLYTFDEAMEFWHNGSLQGALLRTTDGNVEFVDTPNPHHYRLAVSSALKRSPPHHPILVEENVYPATVRKRRRVRVRIFRWVFGTEEQRMGVLEEGVVPEITEGINWKQHLVYRKVWNIPSMETGGVSMKVSNRRKNNNINNNNTDNMPRPRLPIHKLYENLSTALHQIISSNRNWIGPGCGQVGVCCVGNVGWIVDMVL